MTVRGFTIGRGFLLEASSLDLHDLACSLLSDFMLQFLSCDGELREQWLVVLTVHDDLEFNGIDSCKLLGIDRSVETKTRRCRSWMYWQLSRRQT